MTDKRKRATGLPDDWLPGEPEGVSRQLQRKYARDAELHAQARMKADWADLRKFLLTGLDHGAKLRFDKEVRRELHTIRRTIGRVDKHFEQH